MEQKSNRHQRALELDKILEMLAEETTCDDASQLALALQPESNYHLCLAQLQQTEDAHMLLARFGAPSFGTIKNVAGPLRRAAAGGLLNTTELLHIAEVLRVVRSLAQWRERCAGVKVCLESYFDGLIPNKYLEERIGSCILSEDEIADSASPALSDIRRKIRQASSRIKEQLDKMIRSSHYQKYLQDALVTQRGGRYVVPVKSECRGEVPGLVHDTSASGATVFVEPIGVVDANNEIKVLQSKETAEIERILAELSAECGGFADGIAASYQCAVELNLIFAKAKLAYRMKASAPLLNQEGIIDLKKARHPLIDPQKVVPTDIRLGQDFTTLVITGPNTGGKTVSIKTLGLLTMMAMCGLMIPAADQSRVSVFDRVLADIGDEQSIEQSLSTFSSHMTNIIRILEETDPRTLVLVDELGAGTDPVEGAALAMSILEFLQQRGAKVAATTHYAELKGYALQTPLVENACCEFDVATLRPTYRLLIGVPGRSNAFAISERLGLPSSIVHRAKELVSTEDSRFEDVVEQLERSRQQMEERRQEADRQYAETQVIRQEAGRLKEELESQRQKAMEQARREAQQVVERARREAQQLMDELETLRRQKTQQDAAQLALRAKQQMKQSLSRLEEVADPVEQPVSDEEYTLPRPLKKGDSVLITLLGEKGEVLSPPDKSGNVQVRAGAIVTRVNQKSLRLLGSGQKRMEPQTRTVRVDAANKATSPVEQRIDLRGKMVDEAIPELDSLIDQSLLLGVGQLTIIHGKGTGALRSGIQQHLRKHPFVRSYRLGVYGEGGEGVTIVELK